jgi:hypothetical protein
LHRGRGRAIHPGQTVHVSIAFKDQKYQPQASFLDKKSTPLWEDLVGHDDESPKIPNSSTWENFVEMDLFNPGPIEVLRDNPSVEAIMPILQRLNFMADSGKLQFQFQSGLIAIFGPCSLRNGRDCS